MADIEKSTRFKFIRLSLHGEARSFALRVGETLSSGCTRLLFVKNNLVVIQTSLFLQREKESNEEEDGVPLALLTLLLCWGSAAVDRGKKGAFPRLPSLRTGLAGLPHPALRLMGYRFAGYEAEA